MTRPTLVLDFEPSVFWSNKIFDRSWASRFPGATLFTDLGELARRGGFEAATADVFLRRPRTGARAVVLTDGFTRFTRDLQRAGAELAVVFSGESPGIMPWFYHRLTSFTAPYRHALLFSGAAARVAPGVAFHPFYWPFPDATTRAGPDFVDRKLLVMVAGHKRRYPFQPRRPLRSLAGNVVRFARWQYYRASDPWLRFPDRYGTRLRAVEHFAPKEFFALFGSGWDSLGLPGFRPRFANQPTRCDDKVATMTGFRFSLSFENCSFPGYVTEKIFDSLLAGCVPVYCGAPDIEDFVPRECFIDLAEYGTFDDLEGALRDFPEQEWRRKRESIVEFLGSSRFARHQQEDVVRQLWRWIAE